jgi:hypothetical protein
VPTQGYTELCRKTEDRLAAGPRLLIRKSLGPAQPEANTLQGFCGAPMVSTGSA